MISFVMENPRELMRAIDEASEEFQRAAEGGIYAGAVYMADRLFEETPKDTWALAESIGVSIPRPGDPISTVEQVAPYAVIVDSRQHHVTRTYEREAFRALDVMVEETQKLYQTGKGVGAVYSRHPEHGVYSPRPRSSTRSR